MAPIYQPQLPAGVLSPGKAPPSPGPYPQSQRVRKAGQPTTGVPLRASSSQQQRLRLRKTIKARSSPLFDHTTQDNARILTWINRRHGSLVDLLIPLPRSSRHTIQAPDFLGTGPASTSPAESMATPGRASSLHSSGAFSAVKSPLTHTHWV